MNELTEYYTSLIEHVKASSDVEGRLIEFEFLSYILDLLSDAGEFDDYVIVEDGRDGAGRWLIDGYSFDTSNFSLSLFATLISSSEKPSVLSKREVESAIKKLTKFVKKTLTEHLYSVFEPSSNCYQTARLILDNWPDISRIKLVVVSNRPASERMRDVTIDDIDGRPCSVHLWDLRRIFKLESSRNEREEMIIDFRDNPLPCLVAHDDLEGEQSILAVMPGTRLVSLYGQWGARLLEQNVRSFLQHRGKVNKGIRTTILNDPTHFFAYNNGLTTTAQGAVIEQTNHGPVIVELRNLQIVNGGQTTASLYSAYAKDKADLSQISLQMKLTVLSDEASTELVPKISRYANSQNKVSDADLFSNHPFHVRLEEFSRRIWVPVRAGQNAQTHWFYERARGQYLDAQAYLTQSKKKQYQQLHPRSQLLTKTDVAKITNSWDCLPYEVSKGAQKNFAKFAELIDAQWEKDDLIFNELYFRKLICRAGIFRALEKVIMKEDWYSGYRANLVTYAIARLSLEVNEQFLDWNMDVLWRAPVIPEPIIGTLRQLSYAIHKLLLADNRPVGNPSEYAKRPMFWETVKRLDCELREVSSFLISKTDALEQAANSKKVQKVDGGIHAQERVLKTPKQVWEQIELHLLNDDAATPALMGILKVAKNPTKLPSEKQSTVLVKLLSRYSERLSH